LRLGRWQLGALPGWAAVAVSSRSTLVKRRAGTGKSFTMEGKEEPSELRGIIPQAFNYIFDTINQQSERG
jgi:hypothetical protein